VITGVILLAAACAEEPQLKTQADTQAPPVAADAMTPPVPAYGTKPPAPYFRPPVGVGM